MAKKKTVCEYCGNKFIDISKHKCKMKPADAVSITKKTSKKSGINKSNKSKISRNKISKKTSAKSSKKVSKKPSKSSSSSRTSKSTKTSKKSEIKESVAEKSINKKSAAKKSATKKSVSKKKSSAKKSTNLTEKSISNKKISKSKKISKRKSSKKIISTDSNSTESRPPKKRVNYSEIDKKVLTIIQKNNKIYSDELAELIPEINYKYIEKSLSRLENKKKIQLSSDIVGGIRKVLIRFIEEYEIKDKSAIIEKEALCWETLNDCPCFLCPDIKKCNLGQNEKNPITCPDMIDWIQHSINHQKYVSPFKENLDIEKLKKGK